MTTPNQSPTERPARLVQIEPVRRESTAAELDAFYRSIPSQTDFEVFQIGRAHV